MKPGLLPGAQYEYSVEVTEADAASLIGQPIHALYGTAGMIAHMEWAARQHILPYLEEGEEGVGFHVDVQHLRPTLIGETVTIRATVTEVSSRRITCRVEAWHQEIKIGEGHITQALVPVSLLSPARPEPGFQPSKTTATAGNGNRASQTEDDVMQESDIPPPPPAVLIAADGATLTLIVEKRESGFVCTRYDEWLTCQLSLQAPGFTHQEHGPFLLRYEIEEWAEALLEKPQGTTEFLEAPFQCQVASAPDGSFRFRISLFPPSDPTAIPAATPAAPLHVLDWTVSPEALRQFAQLLQGQLEGFPSLL